MRTLIAAIACGALIVIIPANSLAVGVYVVGKEDCECSPLVAKGIVPDTLNTLSEALLVPQIAFYLDKLAIEVKGMLAQAETTATDGMSETTESGKVTEPSAKSEEPKPAKEEKSAVEKKATEKKPAVQSKKDEDKKSKPKHQKRRVKLPPKAM